MAAVFSVKKSEDEVGEKYDRCLTNTITCTAGGIGVGLLASLAFFGRKPWPITLGGGFGLGMAFGNCQSDFRNIYPKQKPLKAVSDSFTSATGGNTAEASQVTVFTSEESVAVEIQSTPVAETPNTPEVQSNAE